MKSCNIWDYWPDGSYLTELLRKKYFYTELLGEVLILIQRIDKIFNDQKYKDF